MKDGYTEVFQSDRAAEKYDEVVYAPGTAAALINERQRAFLRRLVREEFGDEKPVQHDFACGTGRAVENLAGYVRAAGKRKAERDGDAETGEGAAFQEIAAGGMHRLHLFIQAYVGHALKLCAIAKQSHRLGQTTVDQA